LLCYQETLTLKDNMKNQIINYYKEKEVPLTSYDIIGSKCWILPTYARKTPEQKMVQLTNHYYLNRYFLKYIENSSLVDTTIHEPIEVNGVQLEGGFDIRGIWHQFTPVSYQEWGQLITKDHTNKLVLKKVDRLVLIIANAVINAFIRGLNTNTVCFMLYNQNNQYYRTFEVQGDLSPFLGEAQRRLANATEPNCTVGANACGFCPFTHNCKKTGVVPVDYGLMSAPNRFDGIEIKETMEVAEAVHAYLDGLNYVRSKSHDDGWFHPSEMAITPCDRRLYYAVTKADKVGKIVPYLRTIFNVGHAVHDVLQDAMTDAGVPIEILAEDVDAKIHGRTDGAGEDYIVEIKSAAHSSFKNYEKKGPSESHLQQTSVYSTLLEKKEVRFQYFNKNDGQIMEIITPHNPAEYAFLQGRAKTVLAHVKANTPPAQLEKYGRTCKDCPYEHICRV